MPVACVTRLDNSSMMTVFSIGQKEQLIYIQQEGYMN
jgi:hypothetical protein